MLSLTQKEIDAHWYIIERIGFHSNEQRCRGAARDCPHNKPSAEHNNKSPTEHNFGPPGTVDWQSEILTTACVVMQAFNTCFSILTVDLTEVTIYTCCGGIGVNKDHVHINLTQDRYDDVPVLIQAIDNVVAKARDGRAWMTTLESSLSKMPIAIHVSGRLRDI